MREERERERVKKRKGKIRKGERVKKEKEGVKKKE